MCFFLIIVLDSFQYVHEDKEMDYKRFYLMFWMLPCPCVALIQCTKCGLVPTRIL